VKPQACNAPASLQQAAPRTCFCPTPRSLLLVFCHPISTYCFEIFKFILLLYVELLRAKTTREKSIFEQNLKNLCWFGKTKQVPHRSGCAF
jgi:hypothetical protein